MVNIFRTIAFLSLFSGSLQAVRPIEVENVCNAQWPGVTQERSEKLMGLGYEAVDAANKMNISALRGLLFSVKREVESMMKAQVRLEQFIDDAFQQAENKGGNFSQAVKNKCKRNLGICSKGNIAYKRDILDMFDIPEIENDVINFGKYQEYSDQPYYEAPVRLEAGLTLVIIGGLVGFIPFPGCQGAGMWIAGTGLTFMLEACVQGCERQDIRQHHYPQGRR